MVVADFLCLLQCFILFCFGATFTLLPGAARLDPRMPLILSTFCFSFTPASPSLPPPPFLPRHLLLVLRSDMSYQNNIVHIQLTGLKMVTYLVLFFLCHLHEHTQTQRHRHTQTHPHTHTHTHTHMRTHTRTRTHTHAHTHMRAHTDTHRHLSLIHI